VLIHDSKRDLFESGDLLFVAAGTEHHFEDLARILPCGVYFTALMVATSPCRPRRCPEKVNLFVTRLKL
jgi:hypothetical protein